MLIDVCLLFVSISICCFILVVKTIIQSKILQRLLNVIVHIVVFVSLTAASSESASTASAELLLVLRVLQVVFLDVIEFQIATLVTISEIVNLLLVEWILCETTEFVLSGRWAGLHH